MPKDYGMIREYNLKKTSFTTIRIPRGTLLFRGLHFGKNDNIFRVISDLLGYSQESRYTVSPSMNISFYSAPYENKTNISSIYITQYELELILLVKPIDLYNIILCKYPYINGCIILTNIDITEMIHNYKRLIKTEEYEEATKIIPAILMNSNNPEIVLHPHYYRHSDDYWYGKNGRTAENMVKYCLQHRAQFNYFPLLYITNTHKYSFTDLCRDDVIKQIYMLKSEYNNHSMENISSELLSTGYTVNNVLYRAMIDARTGFYVLINNIAKRNKTYKRQNIVLNLKDDYHKRIHTIVSYPCNSIGKIIVNDADFFDDMLYWLYRNGSSVRKEYEFNKEDINNSIIKYYVKDMSDRQDLEQFKTARLKKNNITRKNINNRYKFLNPNMNFSNIESVSSIESD
jgi:hypothetical protein